MLIFFKFIFLVLIFRNSLNYSKVISQSRVLYLIAYYVYRVRSGVREDRSFSKYCKIYFIHTGLKLASAPFLLKS